MNTHTFQRITYRSTKNYSFLKAAVVTSFLLVVCPVFAADIIVNNASDISSAMATAQPGDNLIMSNGTWNNQQIVFEGDGTNGNPITLKAATPGQVVLTGTSNLAIGGSWLVVDGLKFSGGNAGSGASGGNVISFRTSSSSSDWANNCRLTNTVMESVDGNTGMKWVGLYGQNNTIDFCYFNDWVAGTGNMITIWRPDSSPDYHKIEYNYFGNYPEGSSSNGYETIRLGTSQESLSDSFTTIANNYFYKCDGEIEIISVKSGSNIISFNTFNSSGGTLTLRHGNNNWIEGNYFFQNSVTNSGGIRVIGEDHTIINNYFQDVPGDGIRAAISLTNGVPNSALNEYYQVQRALVAFNTFYNCAQPIEIGALSGSTNSEPVRDSTIANNVAHSVSAPMIAVEDQPINMTYEGNIFYGANVGVTDPGISTVDPMIDWDATLGLVRPSAGSPCIDGATGNYPDVTIDIQAQPRTGLKDIGSDETSTDPAVLAITPDDVGPSWLTINWTPDPAPDPLPDPQTWGYTQAQESGNNYLAWYGEEPFDVLDPDSDGFVWDAKLDATDASNGKALEAPSTSDSSTDQSIAVYRLTFNQSGTYYFYMRCKTFNGSTNSCFRADNFGTGTPGNTVNNNTHGSYIWVTNETGPYTVSSSMVGNEQEFRIGVRERDFLIDKMAFSQQSGLSQSQLDALVPSSGQGSSDTTPPASPTSLGATAGDGNVSLDWDNNSESDFDSYTVYRSTTSGSGYSAIASGLSASAYTDNTVVNGTTYYYVVTATDTSSNESGDSNEASATPQVPAPSAPTGLNATDVSDTQINLTWNAASGATSYNVKCSTSSGGSYTTIATGVSTTSYSNSGLTASTTYYYVVSATNAGGTSGDSAEASATTQAPPDTTSPAAPSGLGATAGNGSVSLDWNNNSEPDFASYTVYRSTTSGSGYSSIASGLSSSAYTDNSANNGTTYYYVVTATDTSSNESGNSSEASATPTAPPDTTPPAAPLGLGATPGDSSVSLDWNNNSEPDFASYTVYRSTTSGSGYSSIASGLSASSYTDNSVTNGTTYYYVVTATDTSSNESGNSSEASATPASNPGPWGYTQSQGSGNNYLVWYGEEAFDVLDPDSDGLVWSAKLDATDASNGKALEAPSSSNSATNQSIAVYRLTFNQAGTYYFYLRIKSFNGSTNSCYRADNFGTGTPSNATNNTSHGSYIWETDETGPYTVTSGMVGVEQEFRIGVRERDFLIDKMAFSLQSALSQSQLDALVPSSGGQSGPDTTPPAAPSGLGATAGNGSVDLDWSDNSEPDFASYTVYRSTTSGSGYSAIASGLSSSAHIDNTAINGTTYYYVVTATDTSSNESANSAEVSATPQAPAGWTDIFYDEFESGWGNYNDGGSDARRYTGGTHAHQGSDCLAIQDNSGSSSSVFSDDFALAGSTQLRVQFWFKAVSMENGEDFFLELSDGGTSWEVIGNWARGTDFNNNEFNFIEVIVDSSSVSTLFAADNSIRFRCDASGNGDDVYIDEIRVSKQ
jgi:fibronectin type 3 domain-containing protein